MLLLAAHEHWSSPLALWGIATLGNTAGGLINWLLGAWIVERWPKLTPRKTRQQQAVVWLRRWGYPALLLSWLPLVGDPLCLAAGWLRINFLRSFVFIFVGKGLRYAVLLWVLQ